MSGPSGCGKSTFLSILALLDAPTSGRYWFNGRRVDTVPPGDKARIRNVDVGLIFQSFNLIGDMTVYENVEYPLTLRGDRRHGAARARGRGARPRRAVGRARSSVRGRSRAATSNWWRSRARSPAVRRSVLADEPTGNLDSKSGEAVMQMLEELHAGGATICLATHNPDYIARTPRRIKLFDGRVVD